MVFLAGKVQKKFAAINDSVNLHTSAIGGDKWPEVALHGERAVRTRINNHVYSLVKKKGRRSFIYRIDFRVFIQKLVLASLACKVVQCHDD